jgi:uncharacterized protein YcbK (DUF882 family)
MQLSKHFHLREFTRSQTAARRGLDNMPGPVAIDALTLLCETLLEPVRREFGRAVVVNSGFRSPALNRAIGGARGSQHVLGEAADIEIPGLANAHVAQWIAAHLAFDQLILEAHVPGDPASGWVHVSIAPGRAPRRPLLPATPKGGGRPGMLYQQGLPG